MEDGIELKEYIGYETELKESEACENILDDEALAQKENANKITE